MNIICIGEAMAELRLRDGAMAHGYAGDIFNAAVYLRRLLPADQQVQFLSRVGADTFSQRFLSLAADEGIDAAHIDRDPDRNIGIYLVSTDAAGERSFEYWRSQSAARQMFAEAAPDIETQPGDIVFLSAITLAVISPAARLRLMEWLQMLRKQGLHVAFDSNYRPRLWANADEARQAISALWAITDIALPSVDDEMALFGDVDEDAVLARFRAGGHLTGALKRGAKGPLGLGQAAGAEGDFRPATKVVDTTAAGDSFDAGFLAGFAQKASPADCLMGGHKMASEVIGWTGAIIPRAEWKAPA